MSFSQIQKDTQDSTQNRHINIIAFLVAACLVSRFVLAFTSSGNVFQEISFLALSIPGSFFIIFKLGDTRLFIKSLFVTFLYVIPVTLSSFYVFIAGKADPIFAAVTLGNLYFMFLLATLFASIHGCDLWLKTMRALTLLAGPFFIYVAFTQQHSYVWGRWEPAGGHANWWGMMGLGLAWCSFAWNNPFLRYLFMGGGLYFMFLTQSRGAMVAFLPAIIFCGDYFLPFTRRKVIVLMAIFLVIIAFLGISFATSNELLGKVFYFFANDVLKVNDPYRGFSSGMTGRVAAYKIAWKAFLDSPFLGAGYSEFSFVHNGFLLTLAESGIFSFSGMIFLFGTSLIGYIKTRHWQGFGFVLSYIVLLLTFPRTFNINMVSVLFSMILMKGVVLMFTGNRTKANYTSP